LGFFSAAIPAGGVVEQLAGNDGTDLSLELLVTEIRDYAGPWLPLGV
jgi:hypothetical protein